MDAKTIELDGKTYRLAYTNSALCALEDRVDMVKMCIRDRTGETREMQGNATPAKLPLHCYFSSIGLCGGKLSCQPHAAGTDKGKP